LKQPQSRHSKLNHQGRLCAQSGHSIESAKEIVHGKKQANILVNI
jgi:hypothetical protein